MPSSLEYVLKLVGNEEFEVTAEQAAKVQHVLTQGAESVSLGDIWFKATALMAIVPNKKAHPKWNAYQNFLGASGQKMGFETYLDQINYPRTVKDKLASGA